jgi:hypothetical protein
VLDGSQELKRKKISIDLSPERNGQSSCRATSRTQSVFLGVKYVRGAVKAKQIRAPTYTKTVPSTSTGQRAPARSPLLYVKTELSLRPASYLRGTGVDGLAPALISLSTKLVIVAPPLLRRPLAVPRVVLWPMKRLLGLVTEMPKAGLKS